jgi:hypothetical protein
MRKMTSELKFMVLFRWAVGLETRVTMVMVYVG